jgi:hypothetical protein
MDTASMQARRRWYRRPSRIIPVAFVAALAIGVPVAWAAFGDVPPSNPFYADINAIQGAGVTQGCGGGNFCPTDNITRQAEAAFVHRAASRAAYGQGGDTLATYPTITDLGSVTIQIGGTAGGTQFVKVDAAVTTLITSATGCPCRSLYFIGDDTGDPSSFFHWNMNDTVQTDGIFGTAGLQTGSATAVIPVPTGTTQTFHVWAAQSGGTGSVDAYAELSAATAPFGSTGAGTLNKKVGNAGKFATPPK